MAGQLEPVVGRLVGDSTDYVRSLNDAERRTGSFTDEGERHFGRLGASIGKFAKVAAIGLGAAAVGVGAFLKSSVAAAEESRKVTAQTEAVIKSTGGAANVSASQVGKYADSLAALTGIDDEVIAGGQNMLLTFTNVRNEAGKGNDIFNQGTKAALNMSVALKQDLASSSMLVGKALNDPIAGMTALTRSGIQFTAQQKEQVKAMVAAGDTLGAQKIILKELETQFGGSAEAAASPMARLKVVVGNLQEELGARFLPVVGNVAGFLADKLPGALDKVGGAVSGLFNLIGKGDFTGAFRKAFGVEEDAPIVGFILKIRNAVVGLFDLFVKGDFTGALARAFHVEEDSPLVNLLFRIREAVIGVVNFVRDNAVPVLAGLGAAIMVTVVPAFLAWAAAELAAIAPIVAVVAAVGLLVGALVYAYTHFEIVRTVIDSVIGFLTGTVLPAIGAFAAYVAEQFGLLVGWVQAHWGSIQEAIGHVIAAVSAVVESFVAYVSMLWSAFGDEILEVARIVWDQIRNVVETVIDLVRGIIETGLAIINGEWGAAWDGIKGILATAWEFMRETVVNALRLLGQAVEAGLSAVVSLVGGIPGRILDALSGLAGMLWDSGWGMMEAFANGIRAGLGNVLGAVGWVLKKARDLLPFSDAKTGPLKDLTLSGRRMSETFAKGIRSSSAVADAFESVLPALPGVSGGSASGALGGSATGAAVSGTWSAGGGGVTIIINTATGDIPDETIRKIRSQLFELQNDMPSGQIIPAA